MVDISQNVTVLPAKADHYPKPTDLLGSVDAQVFPLQSLPQCIREAVVEVQNYVQAPVPLVVSSVMGILATVAQGLILVRRDSSLVSPVSLIVLSIAEPNERKSFTESFFIKPVIDWENRQAAETRKAFAAYKAKLVVYDAVEAGLIKEVKKFDSDSDLEQAEQKLKEHLETKPFKPLTPRLLQADATKEASIKHLAEYYPSLGILSAEGGTVLGGNSLSQSSIVGPIAFINSAWGNERQLIDRSGEGQTKLENVALSVSLAVQPAVIEKFLNKNDGMARGIGFIARSLLTFPVSTQGERLYRESPEAMPAVDTLNQVTSMLLKLQPDRLRDSYLNRVQVPLSKEAKAVWIEYYNRTELAQAFGLPLQYLRDVGGKSADNAARLAGIFHLVDRVARGDVPDETPSSWGEVSAEHMGMGCDVAEFYLNEALRYLSSGDLPEDIRDAQEVSDRLRVYLLQRQRSTEALPDSLRVNEITKRGLMRLLPRKINNLNSINPLLDELLTANHLLDKRKDKNSIVLTINPRLTEEDWRHD